MLIDNFQQRKTDVLSKMDKSSAGKWDKKIIKLCNKINKLENYYTTSSCSGRALLMIDQEKKGENLFIFVSHDKITFKQLKGELSKAVKLNKKVKFKLEPCILHVACKALEDTKLFYDKGKEAGFKRLSIIGTSHGFTFELNSTEKLEFPIIEKNKILVDDDFLKLIVEDSNTKLEKSWLKIQKLQRLI